MRDGYKDAVEAPGVCRLRLDSDFILDLNETLYALSFRQNLISISLLDKYDFIVTLGNEIFSLFSKFKVVGTEILIDGLYKLNLHASFSESLYVNNLGTKRTLIKENSYSLW